jgi:hypothetical protein
MTLSKVAFFKGYCGSFCQNYLEEMVDLGIEGRIILNWILKDDVD